MREWSITEMSECCLIGVAISCEFGPADELSFIVAISETVSKLGIISEKEELPATRQ
jgi:hypothetical protein